MAGSENKPCALYAVQHIATGRLYIGISTNPPHRWDQHWHDCQKKPAGYFHRTLRKYGRAAFSWHVIAWHPDMNAAKAAERAAIADGFGHFNLTAGGDGTVGYIPSAQTRELQAAAKRGRPNIAVSASNLRRVAAGSPGPFKAQTHCSRGHALTPENRYLNSGGKCKICCKRRAAERKRILRCAS